MANVAAVAQLMEIVAPATPASPSTCLGPEQSFADVMQQANEDAGVPLTPVGQHAPVGQKDAAKTDDLSQNADKPKQTAPIVDAQLTGPRARKPLAISAPVASRYTSANMLSARVVMAATPMGAGNTVSSTVPSSTTPVTALRVASAVPAASLPQATALGAAPIDRVISLPPASTVTLSPSSGVAKTGVPSPHASVPAAKPERSTIAEPVKVSEQTPVVSVAAGMTSTFLVPTAPLPETSVFVSSETPRLEGATAVSKGEATNSTTGANPVLAAASAQPNAATFQQSLSGLTVPSATMQRPNSAKPGALAANPLTGDGTKSTVPQSGFAARNVVPEAVALPVSPTVPPSIPRAAQAAGQPAVAIISAAQASVPQAQVQTSPLPKTFAKPALSVNAPLTSSASTQAVVQPPVSTLPVESRPAMHLSSAPLSVPVTPSSSDGSAIISTSIAVAHTPLAVIAVSNPTAPALTPAPAANTTTFGDASTGTLQHTTLSSTPTTLEVGVASGTHGWLKIRAELNASGTVDASLTGANAAAAGKLHTDLPALSSFLQQERVAVGSLNIAAPGAAAALHATATATLEATSSFTRSAAESVGAAETAVAGDAGASGGRAPQQQTPQSTAQAAVTREEDGVANALASPVPTVYGEAQELGGEGARSRSGYDGGGSWLNVRV